MKQEIGDDALFSDHQDLFPGEQYAYMTDCRNRPYCEVHSVLAWCYLWRWITTVYCDLYVLWKYKLWYSLFYGFVCLFSVKSAFSWCVDGDLLKRNNLIAPQDYLTTPKIRMKAPAAGAWPSLARWDSSNILMLDWFTICLVLFLSVKPDPARPTFAYTMRVSREPQDGSCTLIHNPEKTIPGLNESEFSLTLDSSSCTPNRTETPRDVRSQSFFLYIRHR